MVPMAGPASGAKRTCTVQGLAAATGYQFQLVAFRGTLTVNAVFGALSNIVSGTTAAASTAPVATVTVSPVSVSLAVRATQQFTVTPKDAGGNTVTGGTVTWASSNTAGATVSGSGLVSGVATGSATISATSGGITGTAALTVTAAASTKPGTVTDLAVAGVTDSGVTLTFTEVPDGTGQPASYDVRYATGTLSWTASVAAVTVSPSAVSQLVGATQQLSATLKDAFLFMIRGPPGSSRFTYTTVFRSSGSGLVTGVAAGSATISATSGGITGT